MPERQAIDFVLNFSKKTGDYVSISAVDGQVIALAVDNIMKKGKGDLLRNEPKDVVECIGGKIIDRVAGDDKRDNKKKKGPALIEDSDDDVDIGDEMINKALEVNDEEEGKIVETLKKIVENEKLEDGNGVTEVEEVDEKLEKVEEVVEKVEEVEEENCEELTELEEKLENMKLEGEGVKEEPQEEEEEKPINPNLWAENKDYDTDDEDGWINPDNFDYLVLGKEELEKVETLKDIGVFIMTSDFAMQNIILQIGIPLLAIDEYAIKRVKTYILECYTCWKLCRDTSKQFCPSCKYATLLKVTCAYNQDGN